MRQPVELATNPRDGHVEPHRPPGAGHRVRGLDSAGRAVDTVAAFTAWHWLDPAVRAEKVAAALRPGGALVTVTTTHVLGGSERFFAEVQDCYQRWDPATPPDERLEAPQRIAAAVDEVDRDPRFAAPIRRRFVQDITYTTSSYLELLRTYSGHRALAPHRRDGLLGCVAALLDDTYGGAITKRYLHELRIARRTSR